MKDICGVTELNQFIIDSIINNTVKDCRVLLYFGASWCGPCKQLKDRLKHADTDKIMPNLIVGHLDIEDEDNEELCKRYKINSLPTQIYIKLNNNIVTEVSRIEGYDFTRLKMEYDKY